MLYFHATCRECSNDDGSVRCQIGKSVLGMPACSDFVFDAKHEEGVKREIILRYVDNMPIWDVSEVIHG